MSLAETLDVPLFAGVSSSSTEIPGLLPVGIGGRGYLVNVAGIQRETLPVIRQQGDTSNEPGEATISPYDLWRRSVGDWSFGGGQEWFDMPDSDRRRFRTSKGIDPWTKGKLQLHNQMLRHKVSANTNLHLAIAGTRLYLTDGISVIYTTDMTSNFLSADDASFEGGVGSWITGTNGTIAQAAPSVLLHGAQALRWSLAEGGTAADIRAGGAAGSGANKHPVVVGRSYMARVSIKKHSGANRNFRVRIQWFDSSGNALSTSTSGAVAITSTAAWTELTVTATAPASAVYGTVLVRLDDNSNAQAFDIDQALFGPGGGSAWAVGAWNSVTGLPATAPTAITTDGFNVWTAHGADGTYLTNTGTAAAAAYNTGTVSGPIAFVKGRLMVSNANVLYNVVASGALPTALFTHPNTDFRWTGFAAGPQYIYAAGFSGSKSEIYKTTIKSDGSGLDVVSHAITDYPTGEIIRSLGSYLGLVFIGTDKGIRMAQIESSGNLSVGALIPTASPVYTFEGQDRFIWAGLTNYDTTSTGLLRMDLLHLTEGIAPAYATDLMATAQGTVQSVVTFGTLKIFTVSGSGLWREDADLVSTSEIRMGRSNFDLIDPKVFKYLDVAVESVPTGSTIGRQVDIDGTSTTVSESMALDGQHLSYDIRSEVGEYVEPILIMERATDTTTGPVVTRVTVRALPIAKRGEQIVLPIMLQESILLNSGRERAVDPQAEFLYLKAHEASGRPVTVQIGEESFEGFIDSIKWGPDLSFTGKSRYLQGTAVVTLRRFDNP